MYSRIDCQNPYNAGLGRKHNCCAFLASMPRTLGPGTNTPSPSISPISSLSFHSANRQPPPASSPITNIKSSPLKIRPTDSMPDRVPIPYLTSARSQSRPSLPALYEPVKHEPVTLKRSASAGIALRLASDAIVEIRPRPKRQEPSPFVGMRSIGTQVSIESLRAQALSSGTAPESIVASAEPVSDSDVYSHAYPHDEDGLCAQSLEGATPFLSSKTLSPALSLDSVSSSSADGRRLVSFDVLRLSAPELDVQVHAGGVASSASSVRGGIPLSDRRARAKALGASGGDLFDVMTASMVSEGEAPAPFSRVRDITKRPSFGSDDSNDTGSKAASYFGYSTVTTLPEIPRTRSVSDEGAYVAMRKAEEEERFEKQRHPAPVDEPMHIILNSGKRYDGMRTANAIVDMVKWVTSSGNGKTVGHKNLPKEVIKTVVTTTSVVELASRAMTGPLSMPRGSSGGDSASTNTDGDSSYVEPETTPVYESTVDPIYAMQPLVRPDYSRRRASYTIPDGLVDAFSDAK